MKKIILSFSMAVIAFGMFASINGNGYYRVKNNGSSRWATLIDNKGSLDQLAASADLHALSLNLYFDELISDPGSIIYLTHLSSNKYNMATQGTSLGDLMGHEIFIEQNGTSQAGEKLYLIYGKDSGAVKYISDGRSSSTRKDGLASINTPPSSYHRLWEFISVDENTNNYFGVTPTFNFNGELYATLYASFAFTPASAGMKVYCIGNVYGGNAELIEVTGNVPANTPVIIKCASNSASDNRLKLLPSASALPKNVLSGAFFNYAGTGNGTGGANGIAANRVPYNPSTMRILGRCSDGSLGFVKADIDFIPANTAYLIVKASAPAEIKCLDPLAFAAGVDTITADDESGLFFNGYTVSNPSGGAIRIVNMAGRTMAESVDGSLDITSLPKGVYVAVSGNKSLKIVR